MPSTTQPKKASNKNLQKANKEKNDEFYTQLPDIERELRHYKENFRGKVVFCNCDDPEESNFFWFFARNFEQFGLKKVITTHFEKTKQSYKLELEHDLNGDGKINELDRFKTPLKQNGDFRSDEAIEILKSADIVVTNPPFSLFREYVAQLIEYGKKFVILGNQNAITYRDIFELIKHNNLWLGVDNGGTKWFEVPGHYDIATESRKKMENGKKFFSMGSIMWFTNLDHRKRHEELILFRTYKEAEYSKYDNYDAIEVSQTKNIPIAYAGAMGVPITFLDKYNPRQFEIIKFRKGDDDKDLSVNGKYTYFRIIIKNKKLGATS
jgi:Adenine-specific methyltransferase EcoRI